MWSRTQSRRVWLAVLLVALTLSAIPLLARPSKAEAHPLGNFTINRYTRIELSPEAITLRYILDMAEIPTFQERDLIDIDGNGAMNRDEQATYLKAKVETLRQGLNFTINGTPLELRSVASDLTFPPGQGGLDTQRLVADFTASMPEGWQGSVQRVEFRDGNYSTRLGWREVVVRSFDAIRVLNSTAPTEDVSDELRAYPEDGISNPLNVSSATFDFEPGDPSVTNAGVASGVQTREADNQARAVRGNPDTPLARYADLIAKDRLSIGVVAFALLTALGFGAIHALSPGHGKTIVAAYLVGSKGTARHALLLGLTVTATHTSSVYALGLVTLYLSDYIVPEDLYPWLGIAAGGIILGMGLLLFIGRLRSTGLASEALEWLKSHLRIVAPIRQNGLAMAGAHSGAILMPRSASLLSGDRGLERGDGKHDHSRDHDSGSRSDHPRGSAPTHRHGIGGGHSHASLGRDGQPITWRSLIGLGIFGGLLPCPSAIVVMLSAIALHRVAFGLLLILAFSLGLAAVLTGIGFILVYAGKISERLPIFRAISMRVSAGRVTSFAVRAFPVGSAAAVMAAGLVITFRALTQQGFL